MAWRIEIDKQSCLSSGRCVTAAPEAFVFDDDRLASPAPAVSGLEPEQLIEIARACPAFAIHVFDDQGREVDVES